ncbi:hypothetical protein XELAEV_18013882mg [Xenopus laevis]|uniref:Uncharacterized protein n=1 Tax=Xenopus laevis TaxID=8355 RepID=A0A974DSR2_XENLA|nr:hypothetical protein XELAEV_18013882mg [Xenopus laevis]
MNQLNISTAPLTLLNYIYPQITLVLSNGCSTACPSSPSQASHRPTPRDPLQLNLPPHFFLVFFFSRFCLPPSLQQFNNTTLPQQPHRPFQCYSQRPDGQITFKWLQKKSSSLALLPPPPPSQANSQTVPDSLQKYIKKCFKKKVSACSRHSHTLLLHRPTDQPARHRKRIR